MGERRRRTPPAAPPAAPGPSTTASLMAAAPRPRGADLRRSLAAALVLALSLLLLPRGRDTAQAALAALANLLACHGFARTLRRGREPLITRYTRFDFGHLPPDCARYTRRLTAVWAAFLLAFAAAQAAALAGAWPPSAVLAVEAAAGAALFVGEHAVRNRRFPHHGPATLRRTLRAVRLAHAAPNAVPRDAAAPAG